MKKYAIGVDVGGSHVSACVVDVTEGTIIPESEAVRGLDSSGGACSIVEAWGGAIKESLAASGTAPLGVGVAMPGPFDYHRGISTMEGVGKYDKIFGLDVTASLQAFIGALLPIRYTNDAAAFALGEFLGGAAKEMERAMVLTLGTGFGSGFIESGRLVVSGEKVPPNGWVYNLPFGDSIADDHFTTRWFMRRWRELTGREAEGVREIAEDAHVDPAAMQIMHEYGVRLTDFILPIYRRFDADTVVLGGNISRAFPLFFPAMEERLAALHEKLDIRPAMCYDKAAMIGAASLLK